MVANNNTVLRNCYVSTLHCVIHSAHSFTVPKFLYRLFPYFTVDKQQSMSLVDQWSAIISNKCCVLNC